jgi:hypothetical protein
MGWSSFVKPIPMKTTFPPLGGYSLEYSPLAPHFTGTHRPLLDSHIRLVHSTADLLRNSAAYPFGAAVLAGFSC